MINKNKETIEKIEQGCGAWSQGKVKGLNVQMKCGNKGFKDKIALCEVCRAELKATIKTSIEWCEDEIERVKKLRLVVMYVKEKHKEGIKKVWDKEQEQLTIHLNWLKEQEKHGK